MQQYTCSAYVDMLLTLGECHGSARAVIRRYGEKFPNRNVPNYKTFLCAERCLWEQGTLKGNDFKRGRPRTVRNIQNNMSHMTVWKIIREL